jgi:hypothetical protein
MGFARPMAGFAADRQFRPAALADLFLPIVVFRKIGLMTDGTSCLRILVGARPMQFVVPWKLCVRAPRELNEGVPVGPIEISGFSGLRSGLSINTQGETRFDF